MEGAVLVICARFTALRECVVCRLDCLLSLGIQLCVEVMFEVINLTDLLSLVSTKLFYILYFVKKYKIA